MGLTKGVRVFTMREFAGVGEVDETKKRSQNFAGSVSFFAFGGYVNGRRFRIRFSF
jgi:hypothetical protein